MGDDLGVAAFAEYHAAACAALFEGGAEVVQALEMRRVPEAAGVALAASSAGLPTVVVFALGDDGALDGDGTPLADAIASTRPSTISR